MFRCFSIFWVLGFPFLLMGHPFTNKKGVVVEAEIISVSSDWKNVTIKTAQGPYTMAAVDLSLDDQQFIKDWLIENGNTAPSTASGDFFGGESTEASAPVVSSEVDVKNIEVKYKGKSSTINRPEFESKYRHSTQEHVYEIEVRNRGREDLTGVVIEYAILWKEVVENYEDDYYRYYLINNLFAKRNKIFLGKLNPNRTISYETIGVEMHAIKEKLGSISYEDKPLGIYIQITTLGGQVLGSLQSKDIENEALTWAEITELPSILPRRKSTFVSDDEKLRSGSQVTLKKGQHLAGPISFGGSSINIEATGVKPSLQSPNGVIVEVGGQDSGLSIYFENRKIVASVKNGGNITSIERSQTFGKFDVAVSLTKEEGLVLSISGSEVGKESGVSTLEGESEDGVTIGLSQGSPAGNYPRDFSFEGDIEAVSIVIGE